MKYATVVIFTIALAYVFVETNAQHKCRNNRDCYSVCGGNPSHAICDVPSGSCHCHDHAEITCSNDFVCRRECRNNRACCNNDHHCHCNEPCFSG